jgi:hypothetical protein
VNKQAWDIFQEDVARSYFANHPDGIRPEVAVIVGSCSLSGNTPRLAGKAACDDIDSSAPGLAVKGTDIIPDGKPWQDTVSLSLHEHALAVGVNLDGADGDVTKQEVGQDTAASTCK